MTVEEPGSGSGPEPGPEPGADPEPERESAAGPEAADLRSVRIEVQEGGRRVVCRISGDLDLGTVAPVQTAVQRVLNSSARELVLDLSEVTFCDSAGLNLLLRFRKDSESGGPQLQLTALSPAMLRLLAMTGALPLFSVVEVHHG